MMFLFQAIQGIADCQSYADTWVQQVGQYATQGKAARNREQCLYLPQQDRSWREVKTTNAYVAKDG
jgi:hypothetical protein